MKIILWAHVPEVFFQESIVEVVKRFMEPHPDSSFAVATPEWIDTSFFRPKVNHLSNSVGEGIRE